MSYKEQSPINGVYNFTGRDGWAYEVTHYQDGTTREAHDVMGEYDDKIGGSYNTHVARILDTQGKLIEHDGYDWFEL